MSENPKALIHVCVGGAWEDTDGGKVYIPSGLAKIRRRGFFLDPGRISLARLVRMLMKRFNVSGDLSLSYTTISNPLIVDLLDDYDVSIMLHIAVQNEGVVTLYVVDVGVPDGPVVLPHVDQNVQRQQCETIDLNVPYDEGQHLQYNNYFGGQDLQYNNAFEYDQIAPHPQPLDRHYDQFPPHPPPNQFEFDQFQPQIQPHEFEYHQVEPHPQPHVFQYYQNEQHTQDHAFSYSQGQANAQDRGVPYLEGEIYSQRHTYGKNVETEEHYHPSEPDIGVPYEYKSQAGGNTSGDQDVSKEYEEEKVKNIFDPKTLLLIMSDDDNDSDDEVERDEDEFSGEDPVEPEEDEFRNVKNESFWGMPRPLAAPGPAKNPKLPSKKPENNALNVSQYFSTKAELKLAVSLRCIKGLFDVKVVNSSKTIYSIACRLEGCTWKLHACSINSGQMFQIRTMVDEHICSNT